MLFLFTLKSKHLHMRDLESTCAVVVKGCQQCTYMPPSVDHIPWRQRTRRQKWIIVCFLSLILFLMLNLVALVAYLSVFRNDKKYSAREQSHDSRSNVSLT